MTSQYIYIYMIGAEKTIHYMLKKDVFVEIRTFNEAEDFSYKSMAYVLKGIRTTKTVTHIGNGVGDFVECDDKCIPGEINS